MLSNRKIPVPSIGSNFDNLNSIHRKKGVYSSNTLHITHYIIPIVCSLALLMLGISAINPITSITNNSVYAADTSTQADDDGISLVISGDSIDGSTQASTSSTTYRSHTITASASNIESYVLSISYDAGSSSLKNNTTGATVISNVASTGVLGKNMVDNTWGWGWSDSTTIDSSNITYKPMLTSQSIIKSDNNPANNAVDFTGKLAFAAKFGSGATAGHYMANVVLSLAIEPKALLTEFPITTMQEMTPSICASVAENTTKQLKDTRDNKTYWVTKLRDKNCWMTQNLALDLTNITLTIANSDVTQSWTPNLTSSSWSVSDSGLHYDASRSTKYCTDGVASDCDATVSVANGHDILGNTYSWSAATANTASITTSKNAIAPSSICPKGWKLPAAGTTDDSKNGSFSELVNTASSVQSLLNEPYYFVAPRIDNASSLDREGLSGAYWSSTAYDISRAYLLMFYGSNDIYTSYNYSHGLAASVRCVAR